MRPPCREQKRPSAANACRSSVARRLAASVQVGAHALAVTVSLLLRLTPALVTVLASRAGGPGAAAAGVLVSVAGALVYFGPVALPAGQLAAVGVVAVGVLAFAAATMLGRAVNRDDGLPALTVTVVSMGIGSGSLLAVAVVLDGIPRLTLSSWLVVLWLAVVNTAFAFTVWNHTMRRLSAMESSLINNTMLVHVAVLAWIFLGERPSTRNVLGLVLVAGGVVLVHLRRVGGFSGRRRTRGRRRSRGPAGPRSAPGRGGARGIRRPMPR